MILPIAPAMVPKVIEESGAHRGSWEIFQQKSSIIPLQLKNVRTPAANILKQEMLALGADAVTPLNAILNEGKFVDVLLLGTERHYMRLAEKLQQMPFFGLDKWQRELSDFLEEKSVVTLLANGRALDYSKTLVMGILNLTPDSFYADSRVQNDKELLQKAEKMLSDGANILDLGAQSTRPGAIVITEEEEKARLLPALDALKKAFPKAIISIDTFYPKVAEEALDRGADIINDVSGKDDNAMQKVITKYNVPWVLSYNGAGGILNAAENLFRRAKNIGLAREKIILDPGLGFGKTKKENLDIIRNLQVLTRQGYPVLLGASRKSFMGDIPEERLEATLAVSTYAVCQGVNILRVHDILPNLRAIRMAEAVSCVSV